MSLRSALRSTSSLQAAIQPGARALAKADKGLIHADQISRIAESLDLDEATRPGDPQGHRWDYVLAVQDEPRLVAVEPHQARSSEVEVVIAKKKAAMVVLRQELVTGRTVAWWLWVTRSGGDFGRMDKARRRLAQAGISYEGRRIRNLTP